MMNLKNAPSRQHIVRCSQSESAMGDAVEKGFGGGPLSNIDSRRASKEQHRFKNPFAQIRLFQILIPQLNFCYFFNAINPFRSAIVRRNNERQSQFVLGKVATSAMLSSPASEISFTC
jgi:hypothetical protein